MGTIHIRNLRLRTIIGFQKWELEQKQDVVINIKIKIDDTAAKATDDPLQTLDYKVLVKTIIAAVESSKNNLLESLGNMIMRLCLDHPLALSVWIKIEKPHALRFADGVAYEAQIRK